MNNEISRFLGREHKQLEKIFKEFQKGKKKDFTKARGYFIRFKCDLMRHMELEEEVLFAYYEKKSGKSKMGATSIMRQEHKRLRQIIHIIYDKILEEDFEIDEEEKELIFILESHHIKEEESLYPAIDIVTTEEEKKEIFSRLKNYSKEGCKACFED